MSKRPLCIMAAGVVSGVIMKQYLDEKALWIVAGVVFAICVLYAVFTMRKGRCRYGIVLLPLWVMIGIFNMQRVQSVVWDIPAEHKDTVCLKGRVSDRQEREDKTLYYIQDIVFVESGEEPVYKENADESVYPGMCMAYYEGEDTIAIGSTICFKGMISKFEHATNPGQFDALDYYRAQNVGFSIFQMEIIGNDQRCDVLRENICRFRKNLHERLEQLAGKHAGILQAMLLGEKSSMDEDIKSLYQKNGISHVLVISGLHFSMIGMCLYRLLRKTGLSFAVAGSCSLVLLFMYGMMTGFGVSAVRAFLMFGIAIGAQMLGRSYDFPSSLAAAVIYIVVDNPYMLFQAGFLLSVGAVLSIMLVVPLFENVIQKEKAGKDKNMPVSKRIAVRLREKCLSAVESVWSGAGIQVGTIPVLLYFFYECATYSVFLNCLILPVLPVVILGTIAALIVSFIIPAAAGVVVMPSLYVLDIYEILCRLFEKLPLSTIVTGRPSQWKLFVYYGILLFIIILYHAGNENPEDGQSRLGGLVRKCRTFFKEYGCKIQERSPVGSRICRCGVKFAGVGLYLVICYAMFAWKDTDGFAFTMLDVGQGQSVYIKCGGKHILYDGGSTDISQVGKYRIVPFLKASGVGAVDVVVVSHMDADHYNGIEQILEENLVEIRCLLLPKLEKTDDAYEGLCRLASRKGVQVLKVAKGDSFQADHTLCKVLHPSSGYLSEDKNDSSVVLQLSYGNFCMMLTGDVEEGGEQEMLKDAMPGRVDVLQVAHHGSDSSSTIDFLEKISPGLVLISCGRNNRYGHPSPETLEKLQMLGCDIHVTMEEGSISYNVK